MHTGAMGKVMSGDARGSFGWSGGLGRLMCGFNRLGFYNWYCGIYQKKYLWGKPYISRERFYRPTNTRMLAQQNWRYTCAYAWTLWALVEPEVREQWRLKGVLKHITGPNFYMSCWLKLPTGGLGRTFLGYVGLGSAYQFDKGF